MASTNTFAPSPKVEQGDHIVAAIPRGESVVVIGAGAFGGWSALYLVRKGYQVTLIDAWGAGNSRSSSGDETRVIRSTYGNNELYFQMNVRALQLWQQHEKTFKKKIFENSGVLWFCYQRANPIVDESVPFSKKYGVEYRYLEKSELKLKFPEINVDDLSHGVLDPFGGYLKAREGTQAVLAEFVQSGGHFIQARAISGDSQSRVMRDVRLSNGNVIRASAFIFACGSWLPTLFPDVLGTKLQCTKQEVYYLGVPDDKAAQFDNMPVWIDLDGSDYYYGIPGNGARGFKIGVDRRGAPFDPTTGERTLDPAVLQHARQFVAHRFPALKNAPLIENRVCPYENSSTGNFIFEPHPALDNVFFLGGGSGHGFKHGPALGELVADCLSGEKAVPALFRAS